jgi:hypothetical protein
LPLDSPNWWPLDDAIKHRLQQTRSEQLTANDLNAALQSGRLRSKVRLIDEHKTLSASVWTEYFHLAFWFSPTSIEGQANSGVAVFSRKNKCQVLGWFFVWKPDFEKIFCPAVSTPPASKQAVENHEERRGRKPLHPWPKIVGETLLKMRKAPQKDDATIVREVQLEYQNSGKKMPPASTLHEYVAAMRRALKSR